MSFSSTVAASTRARKQDARTSSPKMQTTGVSFTDESEDAAQREKRRKISSKQCCIISLLVHVTVALVVVLLLLSQEAWSGISEDVSR